MRVDTVLR